MQNRRASISLLVAAPFRGAGITDLITQLRHLPGVQRVQLGSAFPRLLSIDFDRETTVAGAVEEHVRRRWRRMYRIGVRPIEDVRIRTFGAPRRETTMADVFAAPARMPSCTVGAWERV